MLLELEEIKDEVRIFEQAVADMSEAVFEEYVLINEVLSPQGLIV